MLRSISLVITPPSVSMPSDSGVTSSSSTSLTSPCNTPAWIAAPTATTSSGLTPLCGSRPKKLLHGVDDFGHAGHAADQDHLGDVAAPSRPASFSAARHGPTVRSIRSSTSCFELGAR